MAKRFRETKRWERPSYRRLSFKQKGVLTYLEDVCSSSGIWSGDFELMELQLGIKLSESELMSLLGDLVWKLGPEAFFITTFFQEQYGDAKDTFNAKRSAIAELQALGIMDESGNLIKPSMETDSTIPQQSPDSQPTVTGQSPDCLSRVKVNVLKKGESEGKTKPPDPNFDFDALYARYPRKEGKAIGMQRVRKRIKTQERFLEFTQAVDHYARLMAKRGTALDKIKLWSSFVGTDETEPWTDYITEPAELRGVTKAAADTSAVPAEFQPEVAVYFQAKTLFGTHEEGRARVWLQEPRWPVIESLGGWREFSRMGAGDPERKQVYRAIMAQSGAA